MNIYLNNDNYDLDEILEKNPTEEKKFYRNFGKTLKHQIR